MRWRGQDGSTGRCEARANFCAAGVAWGHKTGRGAQNLRGALRGAWGTAEEVPEPRTVLWRARAHNDRNLRSLGCLWVAAGRGSGERSSWRRAAGRAERQWDLLTVDQPDLPRQIGSEFLGAPRTVSQGFLLEPSIPTPRRYRRGPCLLTKFPRISTDSNKNDDRSNLSCLFAYITTSSLSVMRPVAARCLAFLVFSPLSD